MKLIFGLGNPGLRYRNTRHNVGFLAIDSFAKINKTRIDVKGYNSLFVRMISAGGACPPFGRPNGRRGSACGGGAQEVILLKPQLFMNNSGKAVEAAISSLGAGLKDILVVCDDVNLELGMIRLRPAGSAGGHNGLKSIIEKTGSDAFNRLRIGIGAKKGDILRDYVLSGFKMGERKILKEAIEGATDAIGVWIDEGIDGAMNRFNVKNKI